MSFDSSNSPIKRAQFTSQKKEILWNIIEPGDIYDIKKSMIAKMPGQQHNFMGDHIELVCLMQAAEIQRLCEYLEEYKLRYREIERKNLDRHSYEIQIKELTQKLTDEGDQKNENLKLRDFLKKQTAQLQQLRKNSSSSDEIFKKYNDALRQLQVLMQQNTNLKYQNNKLNEDNQRILAKINALELAKQRQLDDLRYALTHQTNTNYEREKQQLIFKSQTEINRFQYEIKRLKQGNDSKNREIEQLENKIRMIQIQLNQQYSKHSYFKNLENNLHEYQNKFGVLSKEIERLNFVLRNKSNEHEEVLAKLRQCEDHLVQRNHQIDEYNNRIRRYEQNISEANLNINELNIKIRQLSESQITVKRYEQKIEQLSVEVDRLNNVLKKKVAQISEYQGKYSDLQYENKKIDLIKRQNQELKRFVSQNKQLRKYVVEIQNRITNLTQQIQRLNNVLKNKIEDCNSLESRCKNYEKDNQNYIIKIKNFEKDISYQLKSQINTIEQKYNGAQRQNEELRKALQQFVGKNERLIEYENRMALMSQEIQRLNEVLKGVRGQNEDYRRRNSQVENGLKNVMQENENLRRNQGELELKINQEIQKAINSYESRVRQLNNENEEAGHRIQQYESRIGILNQQLQRTKGILNKKIQQCNSFENRIQQVQQQFDFQYKSKFMQLKQQYENDKNMNYTKLKQLLGENEQYHRKITDYENKILLYSQELQRVNLNVKKKVQQNNNLENKIKSLYGENENLMRGTSEYDSKISQITQEYQNKIGQYDGKLRSLMEENDELQRRIQDFGDVSRKIMEYQNKLPILSQELQRVNGVLKNKVDENVMLDSRLKDSMREIEGFRRSQNQFESRYKNQFQSKIAMYQSRTKKGQQDNEQLLKKLSDITRKVPEYESRIVLLSQQVQRLSSSIRGKVDETNNLEARLRQSQQQNESIRRNQGELQNRVTSQYKNRIFSYESKIKQNDEQLTELRRKLQNLQDVHRKLSDYENKIMILQQELARVNANLKLKVDENNGLEGRARTVEQQLDGYKRGVPQLEYKLKQYTETNEDLKRKIRQLSQQTKGLQQSQKKIYLKNQQLQKMNNNLQMVSDELRSQKQENQNLRRIQVDFTKEIEVKIKNYEIRIHEISIENEKIKNYENQLQTKLEQYGYKLPKLTQQIQRLNSALKSKVDENQNYANLIRQLQHQNEGLKRNTSETQQRVDQITQKLQIKISNSQNTINQLLAENQNLKHRIIDLGDINNKIVDYQNHITQLTKQLQRVNINLKKKVDENQILIKNDNEIKHQIMIITQDVQHKIIAYQTRIKQIMIQNQNLRKIQNNCIMLSHQLERVNINLRDKVEENNNLVNNNRNIQIQFDKLRKQQADFDLRNSQQFKSQIQSYQYKIRQLCDQNDDIKKRLQQFVDVSRKITEYQNKIAAMSQQIERLNGVLKSKVDQTNTFQVRIPALQQQNDGLRRAISEYQFKINQIAQDYQTKIGNYKLSLEENIQGKLKQFDELNRRFIQNEEQKNKMGIEIQKLNNILKNKNNQFSIKENQLKQEIQYLRRTCNQLQYKLNQQNQHNIGQTNRKINQYQLKITVITNQLQRLNAIIKSKVTQNGVLESKNRNIQQELQKYRRSTDQYESHMMVLKSELERLNDLLVNKTKELDEYRQKDFQYINEIERLNNTLRLKVEESLRYENAHGDLLNKIKMIEERNNQIVNEYNVLRNTKQMISAEYENNKKKLLECEQSIKKLYAQFQRLQNIMQELKKQNYNLKIDLHQCDGLIQKNRVLSSQIDRLTQIIEGQKAQIAELRIRFADQTALNQRINEHMALMVVLFAEIESLRQRVKDKEKQVDEVRRSSLAPFKI